MTAATVFFVAAFGFALWYAVTQVGARPSITLLLLGGLLAIHGAPMLVYMHVTGPDTLIYDIALSVLTDPDEVLARLLWAMGWTYLGVVAGIATARAVAAEADYWRPPADPSAWAGPQLRRVYAVGPGHRNALWLIVVVMAVVILVEGQPMKIAEYFLAGGGELDQTLLRVEGGGTQFYLYNVFLYSVTPFVVMVVALSRRLDPDGGASTALVLALVAAVFVGKLGTLSKAPPVILLLQLAFLAAIVSAARIRMLDLLVLGTLVFTLFTLVVSLTFPALELQGILDFLYYRIFDIPNEGLIEYFAAFPTSLPHNWEFGPFGSLLRPAGEAPLPNYYAVAELHRGSLLSTSNVMFLGDAWADYSWAGVLVFPVLAGFLVQTVDLYAGRNGRTDEWACITAACSFSVFTMLSTALSTSLVTGGLLLIPLVSRLFVAGAPEPADESTGSARTALDPAP